MLLPDYYPSSTVWILRRCIPKINKKLGEIWPRIKNIRVICENKQQIYILYELFS